MNETRQPNNIIRVGRINYTNVWPIFYHFPEERFSGRLELVHEVPTSLNRAMSEGKVDMGPISSFAYGVQFNDYLLFPGLSVSAFGRVNSILLFCKGAFEDVMNGTIALPSTSATSVNLLKIIISRFYGGSPDYFYAEPDLDAMMERADAALLIGDDAIRASWNDRGYETVDLGEQWKKLTGEWMTFAVWAMRKDTAERYPQLTAEVASAFAASKREGQRRPDEMIRDAQARVGGTREYWRHYFSQLCHDFGEEQRRGLQLYYRYANELGLLPEDVQLNIWNDNPLMQVKL